MLAFLGLPENIAFAAALALMSFLIAVQLFGFGADLDVDADVDGDLLGWLGFGRMPALAAVMVFLGAFGSLGLVVQQAALDLSGAVLPAWITVPVVALVALPATSVAARVLAPLLPRDHTTAIDLDELIGGRARIVTGRAAAGSPARARAEDTHGQPHYLMVEPNDPAQELTEGEDVLIVRREGSVFRAVSLGDRYLPTLEGLS